MMGKGDEGKMTQERHNYQDQYGNLHDQCKSHMFFHVSLTMKDGSTHDGIIEHVDRDHIDVLIGEDVYDDGHDGYGYGHDDGMRQFYPGFGPGFGYGPRRRFRRFRRRRFPIGALAALALLPYIAPGPFYQPYPYFY